MEKKREKVREHAQIGRSQETLSGKRRHRRPGAFALLALLSVLALLLQACGAAGSGRSVLADEKPESSASASPDASDSSGQTLTFGYVGGYSLIAGAEGWGIHTGIFQEELGKYGITEIKPVGFKVGPDLNEAIISGSVDIGHSGDTPAILNRAKGAKTRLISQPDIEMNSLIIVRDDGPQTVAELEGKTIAIVKGSIMHRYLVGTLAAGGVKNAKQISIGSTTTDSLAALAKGEIDAVAATDSLVYKLLEGGGYRVIDNASDHPELLATGSVVVTEDYVNKVPDIAKAWDAARTKALADLKSKPDEYYAFVSELYGLSTEAVKTLYPIEGIAEQSFSDEGIARVEGSKDFLVKEGLAAADFDINDWILR
ncbi:ABC transporter substrate-binding protein [Saccharibacillus sp. CPCC 101409]|uniref:ABC transporter substrate-binding protein n=1 Tax=Saccharibacillus sp. CPCC 101409 TaxID=3058041 RepID=UPI002671CD04|nr:ABC transporter substrate-binding protein [Saccharibacillus sp. CPCC 101409]MDO3409426.1 ABC transporter substrate-binding protein [Saccharibacillus sp. CPCC 101409]